MVSTSRKYVPNSTRSISVLLGVKTGRFQEIKE